MIIASNLNMAVYRVTDVTRVMPAAKPAQIVNDKGSDAHHTLSRGAKRQEGQEEADFQTIFSHALEQIS